MGLPKDDFTLLDIARLYEQESGWTNYLPLRLHERMKEGAGMDVAASLGSGMKGANASVGILSTG